MKKKKLLLSLIFIVTFLTLNSKVFAFLPPHLAIRTKNYSVDDKVDYEEDATIEIGDTIQLYAIIQHGNDVCDEEIPCGAFADETNLNGVIWTSSNTEVATVDNTGKVAGSAKGQTTITAKYNDEIATYKINVNPNNISIGANIMFYLDDPGPAMILNSEEKYSVGLIEIPTSEKENIKFRIENENIAKIIKIEYDKDWADAIVTIKYLSVGQTRLIATLDYNGETYTDSHDINVKSNGTSTGSSGNVTINPKTGTIAIIFAWIIGILSIGYAFWHFKKYENKKVD